MLHDRRPRLPFLFALAALLACNSGGSGAPTRATSTASTTSPSDAAPPIVAPPPDASASAASGFRPGDPGAPAPTMLRAARELTLSAAQKATLDRLDASLVAEPPGDDFLEFQRDVVSGIRAGKLDLAKIRKDYAAVDATIAAHQAAQADALAGLYAALEPAQREATVAAVRAAADARDTQQRAADARMDPAESDWRKRRLERMSSHLGLDAAQEKRVAGLLAKEDSMSPAHAMREESRKRLDAVLTAFDGDGFDPSKLELAGFAGKTPHEALEKDASFVAQLLPILRADQREKLATQRERTGIPRRAQDGRDGGTTK